MSGRKLEYDTTVTPGKIGFEEAKQEFSLGLDFNITKNFSIGISSERGNTTSIKFLYKNYPKLSNSERITFEYVMLRNVNDSLEDAKRLVKLIQGIPAKINLIPFNSWPGSHFEPSDPEKIELFLS